MKFTARPLPLLLMLTLFMFYLSSCKKDKDPDPVSTTASYSSEVVQDWMDLSFKITKATPGFTPPVAARAFGYTGLAVYEATRPGMNGFSSMAGQVNGLTIGAIPQTDTDEDYHWGLVANNALAAIFRGCYVAAKADNETDIASLENHYNVEFAADISKEVYDRSVAYGKAVGEAIHGYATSDGQAMCHNSNFPTSYSPPTGTGMWVSTPPGFQSALQPYWGDVRPFLTANVNNTQPAEPPAFSMTAGSQFYIETQEVYDAVQNLTAEQKTIAEFWSDDPGATATPPGHSISILKQVLNKEGANLQTAAVAYAKLGMAVHDAFVSCWKAKFAHNLVRPITVIHEHMDSTFTIPLNTPPFPEYTSGHSVQSGAAAQVLTDIFGDDYAFTDQTHKDRTDIDGSPRSFDSFFDFADEAAISRLYGGIHYRSAIDLGVTQGKAVGKNISALKFN